MLKDFFHGRISRTRAQSEIRLAREQAQKVQDLLRHLGDTRDNFPLATRFRRMRERLEARKRDAAVARVYADLTVAVHDLNLRIRESFYPD